MLNQLIIKNLHNNSFNKLKYQIKIDSKLFNHILNLLNLKILIIMDHLLYILNRIYNKIRVYASPIHNNKLIIIYKQKLINKLIIIKIYLLYKILIKLILIYNIKIVLKFSLNKNNKKLIKYNNNN